MKILEFYKKYPSEQSCRKYFKKIRETEGITCSKCNGCDHYWKKKREQWECKHCGHRTTLKSGTVMHNSKLPFQYWFIAMHLMTSTKKSFSAKEVQNQLGHNRYQPIWEMMHKIRLVMGLRDSQYLLEEEVELDEGFFETVSIRRDKAKPLKRGRGSEKQSTVLVSAESNYSEDQYNPKKHTIKKKVKFLKMKVINSLKKKEIARAVNELIKESTTIIADGSNGYNDLKENYNLQSNVISKEDINIVLPWVHKAISNAKRLLLDIHHRIDDDFLQSYLNEFCFKFNRRYFTNLFDRVLVAAVSFKWNYLGETSG